MKILFVASEALPYSKTGGLADVVEALPKALSEMGHDVAVFLPRYRGNKITSTIISSLTIPLGDTLRFPALAEGASVAGVRYYFLDDPEYFDREAPYGTRYGDYSDNAERFAEFSRAAIEFTKRVWLPDVLHCHDWQSALVPVLLRTQYGNDPNVRTIPVVFTIHNVVYQGLFPSAVMRRIGLPDQLFSIDGLEFFGGVNYLKGGVEFADYLTTVSRRYAKEIQTPEYGANLDGVIRTRADRLVGILNGADYSIWSPEADTFIAQNYSIHNLDGKKACKKNLLETAGLPAENMDRPLIGIVSRFVDQKGFDLIAQVANDLMKENLAIVALGSGQSDYEGFFRALAESFPAKAAVKIGYDDPLAHKIIAGADMLLIPSRYEPCGLTQLYGLRYGTVPVVRATGGLDDTVQYYDPKTGHGTGFKFDEYEGRALLQCVRGALKAYKDPKIWRTIQANGMAKDFSWKASAAAYVTLYEAAKRSRIPRGISTSNRHQRERYRSVMACAQGKKMADNIQAVNDANFQNDVIEASKTQPVMVDFWADWCRPCHMLSPTVEEIARENAGKLKVVKLNVDENINAAGKFNIRGIPTLLVFKGGQVAEQIVGAVPKEQIVKVLERHIS